MSKAANISTRSKTSPTGKTPSGMIACLICADERTQNVVIVSVCFVSYAQMLLVVTCSVYLPEKHVCNNHGFTIDAKVLVGLKAGRELYLSSCHDTTSKLFHGTELYSKDNIASIDAMSISV